HDQASFSFNSCDYAQTLMNPRYVIQLRSPWELISAPTSSSQEASAPRRIQIPIDLRAHYSGELPKTVTISRRFHPPRTLDPGEKVFCRLNEIHGLIAIRLNGQTLNFDTAQTSIIEHDISALLQPNNLLELIFSLAGGADKRPVGILGEVSLQFGHD
ncbi:MAG: hypothetical protein KDA68_14020, partial [Planctomycetaceae bacterium]|nr:hypothetical protein [Planctomycetaceae bacterium]